MGGNGQPALIGDGHAHWTTMSSEVARPGKARTEWKGRPPAISLRRRQVAQGHSTPLTVRRRTCMYTEGGGGSRRRRTSFVEVQTARKASNASE